MIDIEVSNVKSCTYMYDSGYRSAAMLQLSEFPGLIVTAHDVLISPDGIALRYTEHGASRRYSGHAAAWGGITVFRVKDGRIHEGWSESDYHARLARWQPS